MSSYDILIATFVTSSFSFLIGCWWVSSRLHKSYAEDKVKQTPEPPKICTCYRSFEVDKDSKVSKYYKQFDDCKALRSPFCLDGRCSLHCRETCKCVLTVSAHEPSKVQLQRGKA